MSTMDGIRERLVGRRLTVIAALAALAIIVPAAITSASDGFSDVPDSNQFHDHITAIANAGITVGCGGGKYCPNSNVTRGQMAAFMNKLGALDGATLTVADAFMLNSTIYVDDAHTAALAGGAATECETITFTDDPNVGFAIPFGAYVVQHQLFDSTGTAVEEVGVSLKDDPDVAAEDDDIYQVCFSTLDGTSLTAGDYMTYRQLAVFFAGNIFGAAGASAAEAGPQSSDRQSPLWRLDR